MLVVLVSVVRATSVGGLFHQRSSAGLFPWLVAGYEISSGLVRKLEWPVLDQRWYLSEMRSSAERKQEWLNYSGLNYSDDDRWLRDRVASLFDLPHPSPSQAELIGMADIWLTMFDLPVAGSPVHKAKMLAVAQAEFGPAPSQMK